MACKVWAEEAENRTFDNSLSMEQGLLDGHQVWNVRRVSQAFFRNGLKNFQPIFCWILLLTKARFYDIIKLGRAGRARACRPDFPLRDPICKIFPWMQPYGTFYLESRKPHPSPSDPPDPLRFRFRARVTSPKIWAQYSATATVGVILQLLYNQCYSAVSGDRRSPICSALPWMLICKPLFAAQKSKSEEVITHRKMRRFDLFSNLWYNLYGATFLRSGNLINIKKYDII